MRFFMFHTNKSSRNANSQGNDPEHMAKMGALIGEMQKAGVLLATEGLPNSGKAKKLRSDGGKLTVIDGPFPEADELIAGFAILQVKSWDELLEWQGRFAKIMGDLDTYAFPLMEFGGGGGPGK
jgi:hypothetical protein